MKKRNKIYKEWLLRAQDDERSAEILLKENGPANTICFQSHQIVEKCLKGYLVYKNQEFPKIHHLDVLLDFCAKIDKQFLEITEEILFLRPFYFETRYPGDYPQFFLKEAKSAFEKAVRVKNFVLEKIR